MRVYLHRIVLAAATVAAFWASSAQATNAQFQGFFFDACVNPTGALAARCAETPGALGDLSGDSESSLNPSQGLSQNDAALAVAQTRSRESRERGERIREGESSAGSDAVAVGPFSMMVHGRGAWFEQDRVVDVQAERGYDGDLFAAEIGFDYRIADSAVIGAIVSFEQIDTDFDAENPGVNFTPAPLAGTTETDTVSLTVYGSFNIADNFYLEGVLGYGSSDYEFTRNVVFQETTRTVAQTNVSTQADTDGDSLWAGLNLGYNFGNGAWGFGTYGGVTLASSDIDGYTETDLTASGLNMTVQGFDRDSLLAHLGFRSSYTISGGGGVWIPTLRVEYNHEFDRDPQNLATSFALDASQTSFALRGDNPDEDYFIIGLGVAGVLPNGWLPFLDVDVVVGYNDFDRSRVIAGIRKEF
jgi:uncharacterized protein YhjY with autotransporter beta-barrel domain